MPAGGAAPGLSSRWVAAGPDGGDTVAADGGGGKTGGRAAHGPGRGRLLATQRAVRSRRRGGSATGTATGSGSATADGPSTTTDNPGGTAEGDDSSAGGVDQGGSEGSTDSGPSATSGTSGDDSGGTTDGPGFDVCNPTFAEPFGIEGPAFTPVCGGEWRQTFAVIAVHDGAPQPTIEVQTCATCGLTCMPGPVGPELIFDAPLPSLTPCIELRVLTAAEEQGCGVLAYSIWDGGEVLLSVVSNLVDIDQADPAYVDPFQLSVAIPLEICEEAPGVLKPGIYGLLEDNSGSVLEPFDPPAATPVETKLGGFDVYNVDSGIRADGVGVARWYALPG